MPDTEDMCDCGGTFRYDKRKGTEVCDRCGE